MIDKSGKEIPGTKYGLLIDGTEFSGEEEDLVYLKKNDLYGFMDRRGKVVIAPKFSGVPALRSDGYAEVELNERKVLINQKRQGLVKHILA